METISNALNTAKTAIYGDSDGAGGNDSATGQKQKSSSMIPDDVAGDDPSVDKPQDSAAGDAASGGDKPVAAEYDPKNAGTSDGPSESTENTGDPSSGVNPNKHQNKFEGAGRPTQEPGDEGNTAAEDGGPVNKPHEDIDKPNEDTRDSGDAADGGDSADSGTGEDSGSSAPPAGAGPPGVGGDDGPKPETESHGEGTGEKWEKSTGLAADGGDFDATRPGAGREADRLLAEKGIDRSEKGLDGEDTSTAGEDDPTAKPSFKDRVKDKLHH